MKDIKIILLLIICLNSLKSQEEGEIQVKITNIISKEVALGGYLFLETDGILITPNYLNQENIFDLSIINDENNDIYSLLCFFYKFERFYVGNAKIACQIISPRKIIPGKYHLYPLEKEMSFLFDEMYIVNIQPYNFTESFNIIDGNEFYFYSIKKIEINFMSRTELKTIKFDLDNPYDEEIIMYLEDIPIICECSFLKMICPISANDLPQDKRSQSFNVYIKDSLGNKKLNYFIYPIDIKLYYIPKKNLKIKISKLLTNCLTNYDNIVLDTKDDTLDNVIYSKEGFYLKVKKEDENNYIKKIFCSFHKHPGDTTKIFCEVDQDLDDGFYTFEEYISQGPLEDEDDRISSNYNVVIPTFKINGKFVYTSEYGLNERIYDSQLRDKIYLEYKNKNEILNFNLNHEHFDKTELYLGKNKIECMAISRNDISCNVPAINFENSDVYYIEKMNLLEERERLYILPPVEVKFLWD